MKKLLALLLCVMLFAAVIPTSAFASSLSTGWQDKAVSNTAIKEAEKSIKNMYTAIATDELVFGTAKSLHDLFDGLAASIFDGVDSMEFKFAPEAMTGPGSFAPKAFHDELVDNTRIYLKHIVGDAIAEYINARTDTFKSDSINGGVDPEKYLNVFVAAVNDAVSSEKAQAGLQAFIYDIYALKVRAARLDAYDDLADAVADWGQDKGAEFGEGFGLNTFGREIYFGQSLGYDPNGDILPYGEYTEDAQGTDSDAMTGAWAGNGSANMVMTAGALIMGMAPVPNP